MTNYIKLWMRKGEKVIRSSGVQVTGILCLIIGILISIWTPYEFFLKERLRMRPGFPAYEWWLDPPPATLHVFVYNITNADRFLSGKDPKMVMEEIGPLTFKEVWRHRNVVFNDNSTMTYLVERTIHYVPEVNTLNLNATIIVPNIAALLSISHLWDSSLFTKIALNSLFSVFDVKPIVQTTIYNVLHNNTDPLLDMVHDIASFFAPIRNLGIINMIYDGYSDNVTAFMGVERGHQLYSLIDKYHGSSNIPGHDDSCKMKITNASEAVILNQLITKDSILRYYRKFVCKVIPLYFEGEYKMFGLTAYNFKMLPTDFNRIYPKEEDCFDSNPSLPNGVTDVSKCLFSYPVAVSYVYFENTDDNLKTCAEIRVPKGKTAPPCEILVEPVSGTPLKFSAATQVNLNIRSLKGFNKIYDKFSNKLVPMFYAHYFNEDLPFRVIFLMHFTLILPYVGKLLIATFFFIGIYCIWKSVKRKSRRKRNSDRNGIPRIESASEANVELETFLKESVANRTQDQSIVDC